MLKIAAHYKDRDQATRNRYFTYLRAMFRFGIRNNLTKNNPLATWMKPKENPRRSQLSLGDLALTKECAACHLKWALEMEYEIGARLGPSELLSLDREKRRAIDLLPSLDLALKNGQKENPQMGV